LTFLVLYYLQLMCDVGAIERRVSRLSTFGQEHCQSMLIAVELQVLSD
jgi:hypothetical protein